MSHLVVILVFVIDVASEPDLHQPLENAAVGAAPSVVAPSVGAAPSVGRALSVDERLCGVAGARNAADAAVVGLVAEVLVCDGWCGAGIKSLGHWVSWKFGVTAHRALQMVCVAKRRGELPETWRCFEGGALSFEQVHLIAVHCPAVFDAQVAAFAVYATVPQLSKTVRSYTWPKPTENDANTDDTTDANTTDAGAESSAGGGLGRRSGASFSTRDDGSFSFHAEGTAEQGQRVRAALEQFKAKLLAEANNGAKGATGVSEFPSTLEAFLALCDSGVNNDLSLSRRHRHRTLVHIDAAWLVDHNTGTQPTFALGPVPNVDELRLVTCETSLQAFITRHGRPVGLGRRRHNVAPWLREIILHRDGGCRFPGCSSVRNLDIHHLHHWIDGGGTDPDNLITLCARHHTLHHQGDYSINGDPEQTAAPGQPDGLEFRNQHGLPIKRPPPKAPPDPPTGNYQHPLGERLDYRNIYFHPPRE